MKKIHPSECKVRQIATSQWHRSPASAEKAKIVLWLQRDTCDIDVGRSEVLIQSVAALQPFASNPP